jgi:hypothetical protein
VRKQIWFGGGLATVGLIVFFGIYEQRNIDALRVYKARIDQHCAFIRLQLAEELTGLLAESGPKHRLAQVGFSSIEANDWREIALCVPEGVRIAHGCEPGDIPCMASAIASAALMVEANAH